MTVHTGGDFFENERIDVLTLQETLLTANDRPSTGCSCEAVVRESNAAGWAGGCSDMIFVIESPTNY